MKNEKTKENLASGGTPKPAHPRLSVNEYYYTPQGFLVFTEDYHLKRGYCCKSNCRHCPYENKKNLRCSLQ